MNGQSLKCPACPTILPVDFYNREGFAPCPTCGAPLHVDVFLALFRPVAPGSTGEKVMVEGESSCFYHPTKKAVVPCASCGRFLCALCDVELNDQHLCPSCLESGKKKGKIVNLQNQRTCYDRVAMVTAILPFILVPLWFVSPVTGAIAIYLALRYWKSPLSLVNASKARFVIAIIFGTLQIFGGVLLYYYLIALS